MIYWHIANTLKGRLSSAIFFLIFLKKGIIRLVVCAKYKNLKTIDSD